MSNYYHKRKGPAVLNGALSLDSVHDSGKLAAWIVSHMQCRRGERRAKHQSTQRMVMNALKNSQRPGFIEGQIYHSEKIVLRDFIDVLHWHKKLNEYACHLPFGFSEMEALCVFKKPSPIIYPDDTEEAKRRYIELLFSNSELTLSDCT